jgi:hypothetical protein
VSGAQKARLRKKAKKNQRRQIEKDLRAERSRGKRR